MQDVTIRAASPDDAAALARFAARVFDEAFAPDNDAGDMAAYLAEAFRPDVQRAEILAPGSITLLADAGGTIAGYLYIARSLTPPCVTGPAAAELKRLYVDRSQQSRGVGKRLMDAGLAHASASGVRTLWLGVWEHNVRAQRFYAREGFVRAGEHAFVLGSDRQTDWIMQRPVA